MAPSIQFKKQDRSTDYDLSELGLLRLTMMQTAEDKMSVLLSLHHSIMDGWSGPILHQTVHEYYDQLSQGFQPDIKVEQTYHKVQSYRQSQAAKIENY